MGRGACLAVSSRPSGQRQRRPDGRTCSCCSGERQLGGGWRIVVDCEMTQFYGLGILVSGALALRVALTLFGITLKPVFLVMSIYIFVTKITRKQRTWRPVLDLGHGQRACGGPRPPTNTGLSSKQYFFDCRLWEFDVLHLNYYVFMMQLVTTLALKIVIIVRDQPNSQFHGRDIFCEIRLLPWKMPIYVKFCEIRDFSCILMLLLSFMCRTSALSSWHVFTVLLTYIQSWVLT